MSDRRVISLNSFWPFEVFFAFSLFSCSHFCVTCQHLFTCLSKSISAFSLCGLFFELLLFSAVKCMSVTITFIYAHTLYHLNLNAESNFIPTQVLQFACYMGEGVSKSFSIQIFCFRQLFGLFNSFHLPLKYVVSLQPPYV